MLWQVHFVKTSLIPYSSDIWKILMTLSYFLAAGDTRICPSFTVQHLLPLGRRVVHFSSQCASYCLPYQQVNTFIAVTVVSFLQLSYANSIWRTYALNFSTILWEFHRSGLWFELRAYYSGTETDQWCQGLDCTTPQASWTTRCWASARERAGSSWPSIFLLSSTISMGELPRTLFGVCSRKFGQLIAVKSFGIIEAHVGVSSLEYNGWMSYHAFSYV